MTETFTIDRQDVYEEVAKTTSYTGAKMEGDTGAYDRIYTTDADQLLLSRFWSECKDVVAQNVKRVLSSETEEDGVYTLVLDLPSNFDESLTDSMSRALRSFFVMGIASKWYQYTNKSEAEGYATEAVGYMEDFMRKACYKRKPSRPTYG